MSLRYENMTFAASSFTSPIHIKGTFREEGFGFAGGWGWEPENFTNYDDVVVRHEYDEEVVKSGADNLLLSFSQQTNNHHHHQELSGQEDCSTTYETQPQALVASPSVMKPLVRIRKAAATTKQGGGGMKKKKPVLLNADDTASSGKVKGKISKAKRTPATKTKQAAKKGKPKVKR